MERPPTLDPVLAERRRLWPKLLVAVAVVVVGAWAVLKFVPTSDYVFLPGEARAVAPLVKVPDERAPDGEGGVYMVDIFVRKASLLEKVWPGSTEGATIVPNRVLNPAGVSESQRDAASDLDMTLSEQIGAAVALRALGYEVDTGPSGALVTQVSPRTPADGELRVGDVVTRANGQDVRTPGDLRTAMASVEPGQEVTFTIRRKGGTLDVTLTTTRSPEDPPRAIVGVIVEQSASIELPVPVSIDAGNVGGPSAGLAFALDIVDELGSDIDQGRTIVATGEIELDGSVGAIGGVKQKVIAARRAGADVFLVPQENLAEAKEHADGLPVVGVATFDEALIALGVTDIGAAREAAPAPEPAPAG
ncbi:MAG: PDZ domain-containing protein [Thermoleophilia bacterium]